MVKVLANHKEISSLTICLNTHLKHCFSIASSRDQPSRCLENAVFSHYCQCEDKA